MLINDWLPERVPLTQEKTYLGVVPGGWDSVLVKLACCGQLQCGLSNGPITNPPCLVKASGLTF